MNVLTIKTIARDTELPAREIILPFVITTYKPDVSIATI